MDLPLLCASPKVLQHKWLRLKYEGSQEKEKEPELPISLRGEIVNCWCLILRAPIMDMLTSHNALQRKAA